MARDALAAVPSAASEGVIAPQMMVRVQPVLRGQLERRCFMLRPASTRSDRLTLCAGEAAASKSERIRPVDSITMNDAVASSGSIDIQATASQTALCSAA